MKSSNKVLIGIVAGIVVLIVVAIAIALAQKDPVYLTENSPEAVVHNYLLAFQKGEYERAYEYLSPSLHGYPNTVEEFIHDINRSPYVFRLNREVSLSIEEEDIRQNSATITVRETRFYGGDIFGSSQSVSSFDVQLELEDNEWKIVDANYYFASCWKNFLGCQ